MTVTAHDIRMKEFKRAFMRGYSADDVDTFLMYLAVQMDRRERSDRSRMAAQTSSVAVAEAMAESPTLETSETAELREAAIAIGAIDHELFGDGVAPDSADALLVADAPPRAEPGHHDQSGAEPGLRGPKGPSGAEPGLRGPNGPSGAEPGLRGPNGPSGAEMIAEEARRQADDILAEARTRAERGLERAKDHARQIVAAARRRQVEAEQAEAEASLRLAHLERRMAERAAVLATEARRLDELAASLAEQDLAPALEDYHTPAHAAGGGADVVHLARTADE